LQDNDGALLCPIFLDAIRRTTNPQNMHDHTKEMISARYRWSVRTTEHHMKDGKLPFIRIGRMVRFDPEQCDRAVEKFQQNSALRDYNATALKNE
jgi:hypothetical protein